MFLELKLELHTRRCEGCNRWFATERSFDWKCGSCGEDRVRELRAEVARLERSNAALRGVLGRKARRRKS
jgi:predicted RNA-binding Zn-ribbon protein involved in translation (DUF1610 family)